MRIEIDSAKIIQAVENAEMIDILERSNVNITKSLSIYEKDKTRMKNRELLVNDMADIYMSMMLIQGRYAISSTEIERVINGKFRREM